MNNTNKSIIVDTLWYSITLIKEILNGLNIDTPEYNRIITICKDIFPEEYAAMLKKDSESIFD